MLYEQREVTGNMLKKSVSQNNNSSKKVKSKAKTKVISGAEIVLQSLKDCGVNTVFGYPGGAVLPIYDALFESKGIRHVLVRHEQGAAHAAEGYARSTNKVGVMLVTSGPGITNAITGLMDAYMDSIPVICITGQVPTYMIGTDAFQEADATGLSLPCTKHSFLVKDVNELAETIAKAVYIATTGRPGPVLIDIPKDVQFDKAPYSKITEVDLPSYKPAGRANMFQIEQAVRMIVNARRPIFYTGGGVINSGPGASKFLRELVKLAGAPVTSTLMGIGAYPADDKQFLGMLGMHGTYEANLAMHDCDVMVCVGARFDDRITGNLESFSPFSKKIHIDVDATSIDKNVSVDVGIVGDAELVLKDMVAVWKKKDFAYNKKRMKPWWDQIEEWRDKKCLSYKNSKDVIKPQYAIERLYELTRSHDPYITTEVGQHQMWTAQHFKFNEPNKFMTSGGLGTMGYGLPAAVGVQIAHPDGLVIDIAGEASIQMTIQELSTAVQHNLPVKVFILNNRWMGMVRQWQQLIHEERYSQSYSEVLPDFVKLAEAYGARGLRAENVGDLDKVINQMIDYKGPVVVDVLVDPKENCFPMILAGAGHNEMLLGEPCEEAGHSNDP
jgi:acetolactate synthase-1/2/3 large subunit